MFKLIAIEVIRPESKEIVTKARYKSIHKVMSFTENDYQIGLPSSRFYYLHKGYKCKDGKTALINTDICTSNDFFTVNGTHITFSAIVGENGMGKSTILELLFRLMNNLSYVLRAGIDSVVSQSLIFVPDLYVCAYFEDTDGSFFSIKQVDDRVSYYGQETDEEWGLDYYEHKPKEESINQLSKLFYTVVVNYAAYAYNTTDYINEWNELSGKDTRSEKERCWLNSLFHKNDSYQTPIVLNPFRESGNVDYNNERSLTQERLFRLVLDQQSPLKRILHNKDAKAFVFDLNLEYYPKLQKNHYESERVIKIMQQLGLAETGKIKNKAEITKIGDCIVQAWSNTMGFKLAGPNKLFWDFMNKERVCAINYLVYKTLKIINTYPSYQTYKYKILQRSDNLDGFKDNLLVAIKEMYSDKSHITIKLRRCLAFLLFKQYSSVQILGANGIMRGHTIPIDALKDEMEECIKDPSPYLNIRIEECGKAPVIEYAKVNPIKWTFNDLMPASFFHTDLLLHDIDGHEVNFKLLSSGEKQMIYSMSAILYQIGNIESAWRNKAKMAHYSKICLVFDEVELYFHPKYQMKLVAFLIETLQGLHLDKVSDIQIILATHSPFILSDMPSSNILMLKDGLEYKKEEKSETFGANVYDLLNSQFFMDRFIGEFAQNKLSKLINKINAYRDNPKEEILEQLEQEIKNFGDMYLQLKLKNALKI